MNIEELREYCIAKPLVAESFPFDETTLVFKVADKIFAMVDLTDNQWVNLKCDPEYAIELRERYDGITPGYHMNKKHWNTVSLADGEYDYTLICSLIDHSYSMVIKSIPAGKRRTLGLQ